MRCHLTLWRQVRRTLALWAVFGGLAVLPLRSAIAQISVDDLELHLKLGRDSLGLAIAVRNESDSVQQVRVSIRDWYRDSAGTNVFVDIGEHAGSCGTRLSVFPLTLQVPARATEFVRVAYSSRGDEDEGCWGIVLIEPVRPPINISSGESTAQLTILNGVKIYVHRARERDEGQVLYADVETYRELPVGAQDSVLVRDLAVRFENSGTSHLVVRTVIEIRDETTQIVRRIEGPVGYLTPSAFRDFIVRVPPDLPAGRYAAIVLLDYGADEVQATQIDFEIP